MIRQHWAGQDKDRDRNRDKDKEQDKICCIDEMHENDKLLREEPSTLPSMEILILTSSYIQVM